MMAKDPRKIAEKQVRRAQEASADYVQGVRDTEVNPMQKAASKKDKLKANFNQAVDSGKWEQGLQSVSKEEWQRLTEQKGSARYAAGVEAAMPDIVAFHEEFQSHVAKVKAEVDAMPDLTPEQRIQRMVANARGMARFKRTRRRR